MITLKKAILGVFYFLLTSSLIAQLDCGIEPGTLDDIKYRQHVQQFRINSFERSFEEGREVPVQFHIIRKSDGTGGMHLGELDAELELVNEYFSDTHFHFLRCTDPNYIDEDLYYEELKLGGVDIDYLINDHSIYGLINIFFAPNLLSKSGNETCGFARFPWQPGNYIFIHNLCASNSSTLAHELGHYLGLYHTHQTTGVEKENVTRDTLSDCFNCETGGDLLCDTPADPKLSSSAVDQDCAYSGSDFQMCMATTPAELLSVEPDPKNMMSYSRKDCRSVFTNGQIELMINFYEAVRKEQLDPASCNQADCPDDLVLPISEEAEVGGSKTVQALYDLTSTEKIVFTDQKGVVYKAGSSIFLKSGFSASYQIQFLAKIEACGGNKLTLEDKMDNDVRISEFEQDDGPEDIFKLSVNPNPFKNEIRVFLELEQASSLHLKTYDALGKEVSNPIVQSNFKAGKHEIQMNTSNWISGVYYLEVRNKQHNFIHKMVKVN